MELIIRRRSKGLYKLLSLFGVTVTSVQAMDRHRARQIVRVRLSLHLTDKRISFYFINEQPIRLRLAFVFANLSRGPPVSVKKLFVKNLME
jgi:hypothetical protein